MWKVLSTTQGTDEYNVPFLEPPIVTKKGTTVALRQRYVVPASFACTPGCLLPEESGSSKSHDQIRCVAKKKAYDESPHHEFGSFEPLGTS
jgi:hypothetical protein